MSPRLTVSVEADAARPGDVAAVLASLPESLVRVSQDEAMAADLVAVAGTAGWADRAAAALTSGARGVLVVDPVSADVAALREAARRHSVPVVVDRPYAGNPAVAVIAASFAESDPHDLVEARLVVPVNGDPAHALLDHLSLVGGAVAPVEHVRTLVWTEHGYVLHAELADGHRALLTAEVTHARPPEATLRALGITGAVTVSIPPPVSARPAHAAVTRPDGRTLLPTLWETSHRATWRRLRDLVLSGDRAGDLDDLDRDQVVAQGATPQAVYAQ